MTPSETPEVGPSVAPKVNPESVALRASPQPVTRLNRKVLAFGVGLAGAALLGVTFWSLQPHRQSRNPATELFNVDRIARAESLDQLPKDYAGVPAPPKPQVPVLGEPLPGDLGPAVLKAHQPPDARPTGAGVDPAQTERLAAEEAARSSVFFRSSSGSTGARAATGPAPIDASALPSPLINLPGASGNATLTDPTAAQNRQEQKEAFAARAAETSVRNPGFLQAPASPYQVMAGTLISAALITGINSDLPGQVIASVTEPVYDTATGRHLLIPQGTRMMGRYDSQVTFGQRRVLLVWTRLILPDTSSIALDKLPGVDPAGYAGLEDGVDWHWDRILAGAALSTLLGVGAELAAPQTSSNGTDVAGAVRSSAQDTVNQVGQELTKRNLSIQPTLTARPGFPVRVLVGKDLILRPYQPLFFQRGPWQ
jgi:type IV secretory pathway VirB10-like protein